MTRPIVLDASVAVPLVHPETESATWRESAGFSSGMRPCPREGRLAPDVSKAAVRLKIGQFLKHFLVLGNRRLES